MNHNQLIEKLSVHLSQLDVAGPLRDSLKETIGQAIQMLKEDGLAQSVLAQLREEQRVRDAQEPLGYFYEDDGHWQQAHDPIGFPGHTALYRRPVAADTSSTQSNLEVVAQVRAKSDAYGGVFVHWTKSPVAGMQLYAETKCQTEKSS